MKINPRAPVRNHATRNSAKTDDSGVFRNLLETQLAADAETAAPATSDERYSPDSGQPAEQTLREGMALLNEALACLESDSRAPEALLRDIGQLRRQVALHLDSPQAGMDAKREDMKQADTILAVEAARIRSLKS